MVVGILNVRLLIPGAAFLARMLSDDFLTLSSPTDVSPMSCYFMPENIAF